MAVPVRPRLRVRKSSSAEPFLFLHPTRIPSSLSRHPSVHPEPGFGGQTICFRRCVHPKPSSDGRMHSFPLSVHGEAGADVQILMWVCSRTVWVHAGAEGFSSDGSRSLPELLLSDGRKPVLRRFSQPHLPPPTKKEFIGYSRLCREITGPKKKFS